MQLPKMKQGLYLPYCLKQTKKTQTFWNMVSNKIGNRQRIVIPDRTQMSSYNCLMPRASSEDGQGSGGDHGS